MRSRGVVAMLYRQKHMIHRCLSELDRYLSETTKNFRVSPKQHDPTKQSAASCFSGCVAGGISIRLCSSTRLRQRAATSRRATVSCCSGLRQFCRFVSLVLWNSFINHLC